MWILPSRSRPENIARAIDNFPEAPIALWLTAASSRFDEYERLSIPSAWSWNVAPAGSTVPEILNYAFALEPSAPYYGFIGDDVIPYGYRWWETLATAAGATSIAFPEDSIHGFDLCPHFAIGGDLVRAAGWLANPQFHHNFIDTCWWLIGKHLDSLRPVCGPFFDHLHPLAETASDDEIYALGRSRYKEDYDRFLDWARLGSGAALVRKLRQELP